MNVNVSAIIPCYCCADTIERAVDSVAAQSCKPVELIIIDDASTDNTLDILMRLQKKYGGNWLKIIQFETNKGVSVARNAGWEFASQEYIAFLDADDAWHPEKIAIQYSWMHEHPEVIITAHPCLIVKSPAVFHHLKKPKITEVKFISKYDILLFNRFFTPCVMLKKDIKYRFCENKKYSEDYLLWLEIILNGGKAVILNTPMTILFKEHFGTSGLSSHLWQMELNELENYRTIWRKGHINFTEMTFLSLFSYLKYLRRLWLTNQRKLLNNFYN